ncbi:hypothetical protein PMAYCL1PPCAC_23234, partial [Pristionchus mayeri]
REHAKRGEGPWSFLTSSLKKYTFLQIQKVAGDAEKITDELVSLVFFCKIAVVICCVLLGISVLKKLFLGSDSICGMMKRSTSASATARDVEEQHKLAY